MSSWIGHLAMLVTTFMLGIMLGRLVGEDVGDLRERVELVEKQARAAYTSAFQARLVCCPARPQPDGGLAPGSWDWHADKSPIDLEPVAPDGEYREATH